MGAFLFVQVIGFEYFRQFPVACRQLTGRSRLNGSDPFCAGCNQLASGGRLFVLFRNDGRHLCFGMGQETVRFELEMTPAFKQGADDARFVVIVCIRLENKGRSWFSDRSMTALG
jgi:hypothetical protein